MSLQRVLFSSYGKKKKVITITTEDKASPQEDPIHILTNMYKL